MNRLSLIMLLSIAMCSMALGAFATKVNYKILPFTPILIKPQEEINETAIRIKTLNVTGLTTASLEIYPPPPHFNYTSQTEFKQGDLLGISFSHSVEWNSGLVDIVNSSSVTERNDEYIYFGGNLSAHIVSVLQMYDSDGRLVADSDSVSMFGAHSSGTGSSTGRYYIQVPYSWKPGTYTIRAHVEELMTGLEDSGETTVDILLGPPPQEKHPTPITAKPEEMIIGLEDLPEGWAVDWDDPSWTVLECCLSALRREFSKPVGDFKYILDVRIIQFENVEAANKSFYGKLQGGLSNEQYGHGKVVTESMGDAGFLYDNTERRSVEWYGWQIEPQSGNSSSWATGSWVIFRKDNIIVDISDCYNYGAISQGIYLTPDELVALARIQEAKIPR